MSPDCSLPSGCAGQVCLAMSTVRLGDVGGLPKLQPHLSLSSTRCCSFPRSIFSTPPPPSMTTVVWTSQLAVLLGFI